MASDWRRIRGEAELPIAGGDTRLRFEMTGDDTMRILRKLDDFLGALLLIALVDLVLFHLGVYFPLLQPESHSGEVTAQVRRFARSIETHPGRGRIVVMGNSITAACIQEGQLESELAESGLPFNVINMAIASTSPRSWLLLLENGGITADNTAVVILGLNDGALQVSSSDEGPRDLKMTKTHLKVRDALTIAATYPQRKMRLTALSSAIFRTPLFREDAQQYLSDPKQRHRQLAAQARDEALGERRENRSRQDLSSARLGDDGKLVTGDLAVFLKKRKRLRGGIERRLQQQERFLAGGGGVTGSANIKMENLATMRRVVERLNAKGIKVVFSIVPRSPFPLGPLEASVTEALYSDLRRRGADVALWQDPVLIRELESPNYYRELVHVNALGARMYTHGLARGLTAILSETQN